MSNQIDFVLPWVDGDDPLWKKDREIYCQVAKPPPHDESLYRDWGTLHYWFRGVEKYAPWVRKIYLVTSGQYPVWLNKHHPRICLVKHSDFIPARFLPTFSSHTIELNLHHLEDLSEKFVYFNDDTFLLRKTVSEDFFHHGFPCTLAALSPVSPLDEEIYRIQFNGVRLINQVFQKTHVLKNNWQNWFRIRYGKHLAKTLLLLPWTYFTGFTDTHLPSSFLKSTYEEVWHRFPDELEQTCMRKFRSADDLNQWFLCYWQLCSDRFYPRPDSFGHYFEISSDNLALFEAIKKQRYKVICANDHRQVKNYPLARQMLLEVFHDLLPQKSAFEL